MDDVGGIAHERKAIGDERARHRQAERMDAARAYQMGMVNRVVPPEALEPAILEWPDERPFLSVNAPEDVLSAAAALRATARSR